MNFIIKINIKEEKPQCLIVSHEVLLAFLEGLHQGGSGPPKKLQLV